MYNFPFEEFGFTRKQNDEVMSAGSWLKKDLEAAGLTEMDVNDALASFMSRVEVTVWFEMKHATPDRIAVELRKIYIEKHRRRS